jgi:hypothetical protein
MQNPYTPPAAPLVVESRADIREFPRFSAWYVFFLSLVTLGLYIIYWLYNRTSILNRLAQNRISDTFIVAVTIIAVLSFVLSVGEIAYAVVATGPRLPPWYEGFGNVLSIVSNVALLVWVFKFRNRLVDEVMGTPLARSDVGPVMTFFFQLIYLQFKINQKIDALNAVA